MLHPKFFEEDDYWLGEPKWYRLDDDVSSQYILLVDVCEGKRCDELYLWTENMYEDCDIHHPSQVEHF